MRIGQLNKLTGKIIMYLLLILLAVLMIYPLLWMIAASFRPNLEIFTSVGLIPKNPVTDSYARGWKSVGEITFTTYFLNTFKMVTPTVIFTMISSYVTAYGFARFSFKGRTIFFSMMIACLLLPQEVLIVPKYLLYNTLGWLNTYLPFIVPAAFATYSFFIFLLVQFIRGIPKELDQSARMDGASVFVIMTRIILPLCKPALFSVIIFQFVWRWNDFFNPLIFINSVVKYPVSLGLRLAIEVGETINWNQTMAMGVLTMVPPTLCYILAQRYFVEGVTTTGIKG
jgi:oligogalacturonide transport system permease protein